MKDILLVDDDPAFRSVLGEILKRAQYNVMTASSGKEALDVLRVQKPHLVITDIIMPDMDGLEFLLAFRNLRFPVPIIAMSGGGRIRAEDVLNIAKRLGAAKTLPKPFSPGEVLEAVSTVLN